MPTLPLAFLTDAIASVSRSSRESATNPIRASMIEFRETGRPTFIATTGGRDLPVSGRFWINERDGTVLRSELDAVDTSVEAHITVTYQKDDRHRAVRPGCAWKNGIGAAARPDGSARRGHVFTVPPVPGQHQRGARRKSDPGPTPKDLQTEPELRDVMIEP